MTTTILLAVTAIGAGVSWLGVALVRDLAVRRGLFDVPNERSSHARPTPRLGGLGIVLAVAVATAAGQVMNGGSDTPAAWVLLGLGLIVAALSLIDDLRGLPALARLAGHLAAGTAAVAGLGPLAIIGGIGVVEAPVAHTVDGVLSVLWIAGFMNAFNFMDGIDGIAAGQGAVAGAALAALGWLLDGPAAMLVGLAVAAACVGFLLHNWAPATIFMGDSGSAFLGFLIAAAPLATPALTPPRIGVPAVAVVVWPFLFDTTLTFLRRLARRENLMTAHRTHLYQRLTQAGWSHGRVAGLYTALAAGAAGLVVAPPALGQPTVPVVVFVAAAASGLWLLVVLAERQPHARPAPAAGTVEGSPRA